MTPTPVSFSAQYYTAMIGKHKLLGVGMDAPIKDDASCRGMATTMCSR